MACNVVKRVSESNLSKVRNVDGFTKSIMRRIQDEGLDIGTGDISQLSKSVEDTIIRLVDEGVVSEVDFSHLQVVAALKGMSEDLAIDVRLCCFAAEFVSFLFGTESCHPWVHLSSLCIVSVLLVLLFWQFDGLKPRGCIYDRARCAVHGVPLHVQHSVQHPKVASKGRFSCNLIEVEGVHTQGAWLCAKRFRPKCLYVTSRLFVANDLQIAIPHTQHCPVLRTVDRWCLWQAPSTGSFCRRSSSLRSLTWSR